MRWKGATRAVGGDVNVCVFVPSVGERWRRSAVSVAVLEVVSGIQQGCAGRRAGNVNDNRMVGNCVR